jgi:hypothetical protein
MSADLVSITIPPEVKAIIDNAINSLKEKLQPFLISLTNNQRRALPKMRDKSIAFVNKVVGYVLTNPEFAPPYLDKAELQKDVDTVNLLHTIFSPLHQVDVALDDTMMAAGSDAYTASLSYYNSVKQAEKQNVPNAKAIYEDLKLRFSQISQKEEEEVPASK